MVNEFQSNITSYHNKRENAWLHPQSITHWE